MGCNHTITYKELFNNDETTRITLSSDKVNNLITTRRIINVLKQNSPIIHISKNTIWKQLEPYKDILLNSQIFTDGSWTDMSNNIDTLFSKRPLNSKTSSAIVILAKNDNWKEQPIITINITPQSSELQKQITKSFTAELIAILGGIQISNQYKMTQNINTDCQSATKLLNPNNPADWAHHPQNQLLSAIQRAQRKDIKWTPSHPERKNADTSSYTKEDYDIAMADGACEGDLQSPLQKKHIRDIATNLNITHINTTTEEILLKT